MSNKIRFFFENEKFKLSNRRLLKLWIEGVCENINQRADNINFIFTNDTEVSRINRKYLNHNTLTDIITFSYSEKKGIISGDIFISIERVKENSKIFNQKFRDELHRVIIHGILHLLGWNDGTETERNEMREMEDKCIKEYEILYNRKAKK